MRHKSVRLFPVDIRDPTVPRSYAFDRPVLRSVQIKYLNVYVQLFVCMYISVYLCGYPSDFYSGSVER